MTQPPPRSWDKWFWNWLVKELDKAGLRIVRKPELMDKGKTKGGLRGL